MSGQPSVPPSSRATIRRKPQRARYDRGALEAIVDAALICHVAFNDAGCAHCLPINCWRRGDYLYIHGAGNSRLIAALLSAECCVSIAHLDGLVLARAASHHSMNFRSAVIYGQFKEVLDPALKVTALESFIEHVSPGRASLVRALSPAETDGVRVLRVALREAAVKIRSGGPVDAGDDLLLPVWAGVIPLRVQAGHPEPDTGCAQSALPDLPAFIG